MKRFLLALLALSSALAFSQSAQVQLSYWAQALGTPPSNTQMNNGAPIISGAQTGTALSPSTSPNPLYSFTKYSSPTGTPPASGYEGGTWWISNYRQGGSFSSVPLTSYMEVDGGTANAVGFHEYSRNISGSTAATWGGWCTAHDDNTTLISQVMCHEFDLQLQATRAHITNTIGNASGTAAVGVWINNQSDAIGNYHGTMALGITGESNSGGLGFTSQWHTGIFIQQNSIVPGNPNEAIQINGGSISGNAYEGITQYGFFTRGIDLSSGTYSGAAILLPNNAALYGMNQVGSATLQMAYINTSNQLVLGLTGVAADVIGGAGIPVQAHGPLESIAGTQFTVASGTGACATTSTLHGGVQAGDLTCTGTTGASTVTLTLDAANIAYSCWGRDVTNATTVTQTGAKSTTSVTLTMTSVTTNDVLQFGCLGY